MLLPLPMKRLLWKDGRQMLPLVVALLGVSIFIHLLFVVTSSLNPLEIEGLASTILLVIPFCYSIGAAAVLISMEKEGGQMLWLNGLPIDGRRVAASKIVVIIIAWLIVWLVSMMIYLSIHAIYLKQPVEFPQYTEYLRGALWSYVIQSLLILAIGIMLAWRLQSSWVAIIGILAVLMVPLLIHVFVTPQLTRDRSAEAEEVYRDIVAIVFSSVFAWLGWRFANRYWSRQVPNDYIGEKWMEIAQEWIPARKGTSIASIDTARLSPTSALIWIFAKQHGAILIALLGVVLANLVFIVGSGYFFVWMPTNLVPLLIMVLTACLVASWAGWLVFRSSVTRSAIRFHAERGLRPSTLWWTLHCVPIAFLCVLALLVIASIRIVNSEPFQWSALSIGLLRPFQFLMLVYALSQWISFLISKPVFAAIIAPVAATSLAVYLYFEDGPVYANPMIVCSLIALPLVVTRVFMRSWMDGQRNARFWAGQAGSFALLLCIPQFPQLSPLWEPAMPLDARAKLTAEATALASNPQISVNFLSHNTLKPSVDLDYVELVLKNLRENLIEESNRRNWEFPSNTLKILIGEIVSSRVQLRNQGKPTSFPNLDGTELSISSASLKDRYNESMRFLLKIVSLMRKSSKISAQDRSDWLEMFLLRECLQADSEKLMVPAIYNQIVDQLTDQAGRYQSRRQAILLSWDRLRKTPDSVSEPVDTLLSYPDFDMGVGRSTSSNVKRLGGYEILRDSQRPLQNWFFNIVTRKADFVTYEMLECLDQGGKASIDRNEMVRRIEKAWSHSKHAHRDLFDNDTQAIDKAELYLPQSPITRYFNFRGSSIPCDQWYGDWEREAASLKKR